MFAGACFAASDAAGAPDPEAFGPADTVASDVAAGGAPVDAPAPDGGGPDAGGVASASDGVTPKSPMPKLSGKGFIFDVYVSRLLSQ